MGKILTRGEVIAATGLLAAHGSDNAATLIHDHDAALRSLVRELAGAIYVTPQTVELLVRAREVGT